MRNLPLKSKGCQFVHVAGIIQYPWSLIFNIPARNVLPLRRIELIDATDKSHGICWMGKSVQS